MRRFRLQESPDRGSVRCGVVELSPVWKVFKCGGSIGLLKYVSWSWGWKPSLHTGDSGELGPAGPLE